MSDLNRKVSKNVRKELKSHTTLELMQSFVIIIVTSVHLIE